MQDNRELQGSNQPHLPFGEVLFSHFLGEFPTAALIRTNLMLECLSVTPGVTCHPWPGETEAMSHQRGSPLLILLLSPVLHCFYPNSCFNGRKERLLAVLWSINLEPVGILSLA